MSNKQEYAIGDTVPMGLVTLVCEERTFHCKDCFCKYADGALCNKMIVGHCDGDYCTDNKDVIFKRKEEQL